MASPITAANAYAKLARLADPGANPLKAGASDSGGTFGKMVTDAITSVAQSGKRSDGLAQSMAAGKANIVDVATAVTETEVAIEAMVSVRDKVIAAYEEIMRMPI